MKKRIFVLLVAFIVALPSCNTTDEIITSDSDSKVFCETQSESSSGKVEPSLGESLYSESSRSSAPESVSPTPVDESQSMSPTSGITPTPPEKPADFSSPEIKDIKTPAIIDTKYPAPDVVIADFIVTNSNYGADNSGKIDASPIIQRAIEDCYVAGGGTVFLPAGKYLIKTPITIRPFVTLRGDWQDPDKGNDYGTIILADVPSIDSNSTGLFTIGGSAGVMGITIYYPNQDIENVKPYPFTFYIPGDALGGGYYMLQSIVNCTVINGYRGVGANVTTNVHEMMTIENLKGTFLKEGAVAYNQADVGTWKNVRFSPDYWAGAGSGLKSADRAKITNYTSSYATGLTLGDLEWTQFSNITLEDYKTGIHIVKGKRIEFAGSMFEVNVLGSKIALKIDSIDTRWGMIFAKGSLQGSEKAVENNTNGTVKIAGTTIKGNVTGNNVLIDNVSLAHIAPDYNKNAPLPSRNFFNVALDYGADRNGFVDASVSIQAALNDAKKQGGGIVYLRGGRYRLDNPVQVPAGVELRGTSPVATRDQNGVDKGTTIFAYYGRNDINPDVGKALITLKGENSGISGLKIIYPENSPKDGTIKSYNYAIRGTAKAVYAVNIGMSAAYNGIDFRGANSHFIKRVVSCAYNNAIYIGNSTGGHIEGCLQNGNVVSRNGYNFQNWLTEAELFTGLFNPITRKKTIYIKMDQANTQTVLNTFAYGVKTFISSNNSTDVNILNVGADNIGRNSPLLDTSGGSISVVNMMRYNGISFSNNKTDLSIINRISINEFGEENIK